MKYYDEKPDCISVRWLCWRGSQRFHRVAQMSHAWEERKARNTKPPKKRKERGMRLGAPQPRTRTHTHTHTHSHTNTHQHTHTQPERGQRVTLMRRRPRKPRHVRHATRFAALRLSHCRVLLLSAAFSRSSYRPCFTGAASIAVGTRWKHRARLNRLGWFFCRCCRR